MTNNVPLCVFSIQICFSCINSIFVIIVRLTNESNGSQAFAGFFH